MYEKDTSVRIQQLTDVKKVMVNYGNWKGEQGSGGEWLCNPNGMKATRKSNNDGGGKESTMAVSVQENLKC